MIGNTFDSSGSQHAQHALPRHTEERQSISPDHSRTICMIRVKIAQSCCRDWVLSSASSSQAPLLPPPTSHLPSLLGVGVGREVHFPPKAWLLSLLFFSLSKEISLWIRTKMDGHVSGRTKSLPTLSPRCNNKAAFYSDRIDLHGKDGPSLQLSPPHSSWLPLLPLSVLERFSPASSLRVLIIHSLRTIVFP